ncbi:hypothetical protein E9993_05270 [Labilibacter sediminis]|nr:hypothetical protein E9993_05270 [Labilibacter sediminis]
MKTINLLFVALLCFVFPSMLKAIDGYFMLGYGTVSKGMGGTGVAYYKTSIIGNNPAGRAYLGKQYSFVANFMMPSVSFTVSGTPSGPPAVSLMPGTVESDINLLFIPNVGANWQINDQSAFGFSISGSGIASDYPAQVFGDQSIETTGVNFMQINADPTYSLKLGDKHSVGVSAVLTYQRFKAEGLSMFGEMGISTNKEKLSNNGVDNSFGAGFKLGYMGEVMDGLHLGATYQSRTYMGKFDEYAGLFAEEGGFDAPSNWTLGLNYEVSEKVKVLFDVQQINYSKIKSIGNPMSNLNEGKLLGSDDGAGFGWKDMTIFKFGTEVQASESLILRGGYAFGEEPIPSSEVMFNILAPAINNQHITVGATKTFGEKAKDLNIALVYAPANTVKGPNPMDPAQQIELEMGVFEVELSITF